MALCAYFQHGGAEANSKEAGDMEADRGDKKNIDRKNNKEAM